jgi:hypothetical protein
MAQVSQLNISISENFVNSLYDTIRQKLPRKLEPTHHPSHPPEHQEHAAKSKVEEDKQWESENRQHNFPGLAIPDGDEIDLDLDLPEGTQNQMKEETVKKEELSAKKKEEH